MSSANFKMWLQVDLAQHHQAEQQQTQDAALRGAGFQGDDIRDVIGKMVCWRGSQAASYMEGV